MTMYGSKDIFDWFVHHQIREHISLPGPEVVDIKPHFDLFLGYVIETLKKVKKPTS